MKQLMLIISMLMLSTSIVLAAPPVRNPALTDIQAQGQLQDQDQRQAQGQAQAAVAAQGQVQDQVANGSVSVGGDSNKNKTYAASYPNLTGGEGVSQANAYSVFGGLGLSNTEAYKKYLVQMQAIEASQILTAEEKAALTKELIAKLMQTNKKQRLLGIFCETSGRNLLNLFGILSWDSMWNEDQEPFSKKKKN